MSWAPKYGLKGMIDASVRVIVESDMNTVNEKIMPLEFKSGKAPSGQVCVEIYLDIQLKFESSKSL